MAQLSTRAALVWAELLELDLKDRAELLGRLAEDLAGQALRGRLGLEAMQRAALDMDPEPEPAPRRRNKTKKMPRPALALDGTCGGDL